MNTIFNNLKYFINRKDVTNEEWEHFYRTRWAHEHRHVGDAAD